MYKYIPLLDFMQQLFGNHRIAAQQASEIREAILAARSLRLTEIVANTCGSMAANYKCIRCCCVQQVDPRAVLWRMFGEQVEFVIGDLTEIERPQAWKTEYVGMLKDDKIKGFWAMLLAMPYRG